MARAHDKDTGKSGSAVPLTSLFADELSAQLPQQRDCFTVHGPEILLEPLVFSAMALVIHELVTNSSKYRALSAQGRVDVFVTYVDNDGMMLRWQERRAACHEAVTPRIREILAEQTPGFAMPDIAVGGDNSHDLAAEISSRSIQFIFASGYGEVLQGRR